MERAHGEGTKKRHYGEGTTERALRRGTMERRFYNPLFDQSDGSNLHGYVLSNIFFCFLLLKMT